VSQKNAPTLASCSLDKHGLISIIFGKRHRHTFRNDMLVQLFLSLHVYLRYLLLNSCDGNNVFWHSSVPVKQYSSFSRKHRTLSLQICVRQTVRLTTEFVDWCRYVHVRAYIVHTCTRYQPFWPVTNQLVNGKKTVTCNREGKTTSLWTSAKLKPALFRANTLRNRLFSEPPTNTEENTLFRVISIAAI